jgi:hypothetical protein
MVRRRLSWRLGVGAENREGNAIVGEHYLHVTCGSPPLIGAQRGDFGGGGQLSRAYADVAVTYVDVTSTVLQHYTARHCTCTRY